MKIKGVILATATALAVIVGSGCASSRYAQSTGEYIDSRTLNTKVKTALLTDDQVKGTDIDVDVWKSVVQLNGFVETEEQRQRAEQLAWGVSGVRGVSNNLALKTDIPIAAAGAPAGIQSGGGGEGITPKDPSLVYVQVMSNPSFYYGSSMELEGNVDTIVAEDAFTISNSADRDKPLLVMASPDDVRNLTPGQNVRIQGTFKEFDKEQIERRNNVRLPDHKFDEFDGKPAVLAEQVSRSSEGGTSGNRSNNEGQGIEGRIQIEDRE